MLVTRTYDKSTSYRSKPTKPMLHDKLNKLFLVRHLSSDSSYKNHQL
jgi:hypothetical protein